MAAVFALWALVEAYRCLGHAMWRDEAAPWLYGLYSATPIDLVLNTRSESHPLAWFLLTWIFSRLTWNPVGIQLLNLACMLLGMSLIFFRSRFGALEKILLSLSYLLFFEYGVISRVYSLAFLTVVLFCVSSRPWVKLLWLGVLANTTFFGWIISVPLAAERIWAIRSDPRHAARSSLGYAALALVGIVSVIPAPGKHYGADWFLGWDPSRLGAVLQVFDATFLPVTLSGGGGLLIGHWPPRLIPLSSAGAFAAAALILALICAVLWRDRARLAVFLAGALGVLAFSYTMHFAHVRHCGQLFLLLLACAWNPESLGTRGRPLWIGLLAVAALGGLQTLWGPLASLPFSQARNAGTFLRERGLAKEPILGAADYAAMPVAAYAGTPIFYPSYGRTMSFLVDSQERRVDLTRDELGRSIEGFVIGNLPRRSVLVLSEPIDGLALSPTIRVEALASFTGSYVGEDYYLYLAGPEFR
jgi:hypothetical protein